MADELVENASPNLAALGKSFDHATTWALMRILELVRRDADGLAGIVFMRCGDEEILSTDFRHCAEKAEEFQRQHVSKNGEAVGEYLIAYEGRWRPEHIGDLRAVFLELQSGWMPEPIRGRVDLFRDDSGIWFLDDTMHPFNPAKWSLRGFRAPRDETALSQKVAREHALVRQEIEKIKIEQKSYRDVSNRETGHPKFGRWHLQIQSIGEGIKSLNKKIKFVEDQIRSGETPSVYDYQFPEHSIRPPREPESEPKPESEKIIAPNIGELRELAEDILPICWRHIWKSGTLFMRINAIAKVHADLLICQLAHDRIQAATSAHDLKQIEHELKRIQDADDSRQPPTLEQSKLEQEKSTLIYLKAKLDRSKEFENMLAAEPLHNEAYVGRTVAGLEERIAALNHEEAELKKHLKLLEQTKVDDPPMAWYCALSMWIFDCREESPIPEQTSLSQEERARKKQIESYIRHWWSVRYPEIVAARLREIGHFITAEPWVVLFTSDFPGIAAAEEAMVPDFPRGHMYLLCQEYDEWVQRQPDNGFIWHIRVSILFQDPADSGIVIKASEMFPDVPPGQLRIQSITEQWRDGSFTKTDKLWRWSGREFSLLAETSGGTV